MAAFEPIGWVSCPQRYRYEAPRQGVLMPDNRALVTLREGQEYEAGLDRLEGFDRIWLIFELHLNETWHPRVQPPHAGAPRCGVFATRSPHRPNRIGLTCVCLLGIDGLELTVAGHDLLDGTPVWDIKPYVPYSDAFSEARAGWLDELPQLRFAVSFSETAAERAEWVRTHGDLDCVNFAGVQLSQDPTDAQRKRITRGGDGDAYVIAYRTWRLHYRVSEPPASVRVEDIGSGYAAADLVDGTTDPHADKDVHRAFLQHFGDD